MYVMTNLELTDEEQLDWTSPMPMSAPKYPPGLRICLNQSVIDKLKLSLEEAEVGGMVHFAATARITSVSTDERERPNGETFQDGRVELQIEDMCIESDDEEEEAPSRPRADPKALYNRS